MEMKKIVIEIPKKASSKEIKELIKKFFLFDISKHYNKSKDFPKVRIKWRSPA